jgi:uncharacterized protein YkwD
VVPAAVGLALLVPSASASAACHNTHVAAADARAATATLCLINAQRTQRGLPKLTRSVTLGRAARAFARDMVARRFFDHVSPDGGTLEDRLRAAGWSPSGSWSIGENIAWGSGRLGTPASIVHGWMTSPGHRANILKRGFRQIGIGIARGAPQGGVGGPAGTYVTDFAGGA